MEVRQSEFVAVGGNGKQGCCHKHGEESIENKQVHRRTRLLSGAANPPLQ